MVIQVKHAKTNAIADWTQPQLDAIIAGGAAPLPPVGTTLAEVTLSSDWNDDHVIDTTGASNGDVLTIVAGEAEWSNSPVIIQPTEPAVTSDALWIQTGLGCKGTGFSLWYIEA